MLANSDQKIMKSPSRRGLKLSAVGVVVGAALALLAPLSASAASDSGFHPCVALYGWVTGTTTGSGGTEIKPPGSALTYGYATTGTRTLVAMNQAGFPALGGGSWSVSGGSTANGNPFCRTWG